MTHMSPLIIASSVRGTPTERGIFGSGANRRGSRQSTGTQSCGPRCARCRIGGCCERSPSCKTSPTPCWPLQTSGVSAPSHLTSLACTVTPLTTAFNHLQGVSMYVAKYSSLFSCSHTSDFGCERISIARSILVPCGCSFLADGRSQAA